MQKQKIIFARVCVTYTPGIMTVCSSAFKK
jgi:hypothetical protein